MKYYKFLLLIIYCISCSTKPIDVIVENKKSNLQHKYYGGIKNSHKSLITTLNKEDSLRGYKVEYRKKEDTTIVHIIDTIKVDYDASYQIEIYWKNKNISSLTCDKKLKINSNELTFIFCYDEAIKFLKLKKDIDVQFAHYNDILNIISTQKPESIKIDADILISDLIKEIPFGIVDDFHNSNISKVIIGDFNTSFSGGTEHYIIDNKNDTIAYFEFTRWVD